MNFLISNFSSIMEEFKSYYLDSKYFLLFIVAIILNIFLVKKSENKKERVLLVWVPIVIMLILFNPIVFKILDPFIGDGEGDTYWRMFWILPIAPILGYAFTRIATMKDTRYYISIVSCFFVIVIALCGRFVYIRENFMISNNWYKMPPETLQIIELIEEQNVEYKKVYAPSNMVEWFRQYDGNIGLVYGRQPSIIVFMGREIDAGRLKDNMERLFDYDHCNFIVLQKDIEYDVNLEDYNFNKIGTTPSYELYMLQT